jgi:hypothetical protein
VEDRHSQFERPTTRICDMLLGPPLGRAWLTDHLNEVVGQLNVELVAQQEAEAELEALRSLAARFWDLVLGGVDGSSSLAMSMSAVVELLENWIDASVASPCPQWQSFSGTESMLQPPTGSIGDPVLCWLPPFHISRCWTLI